MCMGNYTISTILGDTTVYQLSIFVRKQLILYFFHEGHNPLEFMFNL